MDRVSVIIPCFKQAHFLDDAILSVRRQSYGNFEIIVIDDGSPDRTSEVVACYPEVHYIRQDNMGQPSARNRGFRTSKGEFVVFLDADDRLLPRALDIGVTTLRRHPECAFVFGGCSLIAADGTPLPYAWSADDESDHYAGLLRGNPIVTPGTVMFRRDAILRNGGFDTSLRASEDYELYLRITRNAPVFCHGEIILERRKHQTNLTNSSLRTWPSALAVRLTEWEHARRSPAFAEAYRVGFERFVDNNISGVFRAGVAALRRGDFGEAFQAAVMLMTPPRMGWYAVRKLVRTAISSADRLSYAKDTRESR